ncbi:hypothetical protein ACOBQJ_13960 [Pelotomaculum propionicicum]|uniref:hypothetical protein n=1 Tax=Pelotomaculum propionicicum TaxID=258475 RepID=UPI003B77343E
MKLLKTWQSAKMAVFSVVLIPALFVGIAACGTVHRPGLLSWAVTPDQKISSPVNPAPNGEILKSLEVSVMEFGVKGDGITDNAKAIMAAIDYVNSRGGGVVRFPAAKYMSRRFGLFNCHNVTLLLEPGAVLQMIDSQPEELYQPFIRITDGSTNCHIIAYNAEIRRNKELYTSGEHRHVLSLNRCEGCSVKGGKIYGSGGDGIYLAYPGAEGYPRSILIKEVWLENNRRQGISVISGTDIKIYNVRVSNTSGTKPGAAIDIEPNEGHYIYSVDILNLESIDNQGAALQIYPRFGAVDIESRISVSGIKSDGDQHVLFIGGCRDRTKPMKIDIRGLEGSGHRSSGIILREIGGGTSFNISGRIRSDNKPAIAVGHDTTDEQLIKGSPEAYVDLTVEGSGYTIYSYTSSKHLYNMSKNMFFKIRNNGTGRIANFGNFFAKVDTDVVSYNDKKRDSILGPWDTMQGTRIVRSIGEVLLTLDDSKYRPGSIVKAAVESDQTLIIKASGSGKFLPFDSDTVQSSWRGSLITLQKLESNDWSVVEYSGLWDRG